MFIPHFPRLRSSLCLLISLTIIAGGLAWPNRAPGRSNTLAASPQASQAPVNHIDDAGAFVRQHYIDFLNREPDTSGLQFWKNEIESCGTSAQCVEVKRINVSAAFFLSIEFQQTNYLIYRAHKAAYGNIPAKPVPITLTDMLFDTPQLRMGVVVGADNWERQLEENKRDYFDEFVTRPRFTSLYPQTLTPEQFVDALNANAGAALSQAERNALVNNLKTAAKTRAQVFRAVTEDADLARAEFNKAFVLMQYFGYLRRNPDALPDTNFDGWQFWLQKLNQFGGNFVAAEMVKAFIGSIEYRNRFAQPQLSVFNNPADPLLLRAVTAKGDVVEYFGEKNDVGTATDLNSVRVKNPDNKVTNIVLDDLGRPKQIKAFNGVVFKITWLSNTSIVVSALSADGTIQVNLPVNLAEQTTASAASPSRSTSACKRFSSRTPLKSSSGAQGRSINRAPRGGSPLKVEVTEGLSSKNLPTPDPTADAATSLVNLTRCGTAVNDADVSMTVIPSSTPSNAYNVPGALTGPGRYAVSIPTQPSAGQNAENLCGDIAGALSVGCDGLSVIPVGAELLISAQIAAAVSAIATPAAGAAVFTACEVGFAAARLYCATLGYSPAPGAPSLLELLCGNISEIVDRFAAGQVRLIPMVFIPGEGLLDTGSGVNAPATGPFPNFNINAGSEAKIASFTTTPADPTPFQSYIAEALIQCAPAGTRVSISIEGTDGYTDSATVTLQGDANVSLTVPGAEEGVRDIITVVIGGGPTRAIVIIF